MPEYLAPGVYVEEKDTGAKAIEGVSTTTTGMVGITERGPEGVPTLVIGFADFRRQFGGLLDRRVYTAANWYLPHAVDGFFTNGGKRLYVVRVLPEGALASAADLFDRGASAALTAWFAAPVSKDDTLLLVSDVTALSAGDWLKIEDEEATEYVQVDSTTSSFFAARGAFRFTHGDQAVVKAGSVTAPSATDTLDGDVGPTDDTITIVNGITPATGQIVQLGSGATLEYAVVKNNGSTTETTPRPTITFTHKLLFSHIGNNTGTNTPESIFVVTFQPGTAETTLDGALTPPAARFRLLDPAGFGAGDLVEVAGAPGETEYRFIDPLRFIQLGAAAGDAHAAGSTVKGAKTNNTQPRALTADTVVGSMSITLDDASSLLHDDLLVIGSGDAMELIVVDAVDLNTSIVTLKNEPADHKSGTVVSNVGNFSGTATLVDDLDAGSDLLAVQDVTGLAVGDVVEIGGATTETRLLASLPSPVTFAAPVQSQHASGVRLLGRSPLIEIEAIDRGVWGNDLYVVAEDDDPILDTFVNADANAGDQLLEMRTTVGVEVGSVLEVGYVRATTTPLQPEQSGELLKVSKVTSKGVELAAPLVTGVTMGITRVRTREFRLSVQLRQINPATNKTRVIEGEAHRHLSMDPRHTRYFAKVIGHKFRDSASTPKQADGRTQGESDLIRVEDVLLDTLTGIPGPDAEGTIRLGPDLNTDTLPDLRVVAVASRMSGGTDNITNASKQTYIGVDDLDPRERRGLHALKNIDEVSIVAIPGRTEQEVQQALLDHCELMRYRFAVLDAGPDEKIAEVQEHRSLYDSKYGAIYHPWLMIDDPFPDNPRIGGKIAIPPSGHVIGIYARSDIERGVHKAPANEVVRGIAGLATSLAKEHQDILNPRNINVIRNFRDSNRGLRVWGARALSSDPDWKYINVRRLFIFMEHSIDRGTQWVVFEPNSELLWQRVRRVISSFLRAVWRDGALMGLTPEEAFFVKCDRTTMSQNDIDNGRLIVEIGVAPVKPAEFVIFRIGQWAGGSNVDEG